MAKNHEKKEGKLISCNKSEIWRSLSIGMEDKIRIIKEDAFHELHVFK